MKKISKTYTFLSTSIPKSVGKYINQKDGIYEVTVLTNIKAYSEFLPNIEKFSRSNRTIESAIDATTFGRWSISDAQDYILSILQNRKVRTAFSLIENSNKEKHDNADGGNRTRVQEAYENDAFPLKPESFVTFRGVKTNVSGLTHSQLRSKYKQLYKTCYLEARITVDISYKLNARGKVNKFLSDNKIASVKKHENLFIQPTEIISSIRNIGEHPFFQTYRYGKKNVPKYVDMTSKNLELQNNILHLYAYTYIKHSEGKDISDVSFSKARFSHIANTFELDNKEQKLAWNKMISILDEMKLMYDDAPTTKFDPDLTNKSQSISTKSRYVNLQFFALDNLEFLFGVGAVIRDRKTYQSGMIQIFSELDECPIGLDEAVFTRFTRKFFDPVKKDAKIQSRIYECLILLAEKIHQHGPEKFGIVYKDPIRCFPRSMIDRKFAEQNFQCPIDGTILRKEARGGHNMAHSKGGTTTYDNLIVVSKRVNDAMGSLSFEEYCDMIGHNQYGEVLQ